MGQIQGLLEIYSHKTKSIFHNPNLGLVSKARACESAGQEWNQGVTLHALGSVVECEGMNPHTPKWTPTLGVRALMASRIYA
jgi:hypothetical protein